PWVLPRHRRGGDPARAAADLPRSLISEERGGAAVLRLRRNLSANSSRSGAEKRGRAQSISAIR
ncbi:MAG: hypothetical protein QUU85_10735, partial [Candidatus Eisenbacteria bacterium]|nr:hypothetical protein [Candidatus Eisenbacteria bacterium]